MVTILLTMSAFGLNDVVASPYHFLGWFIYILIESFGSIVVAPELLVIVKLFPDRFRSWISFVISKSASLIKFVKDRLGHDRRYAIDASKIKKELGWKPLYSFDDKIKETIDWYLTNTDWVDNIISGEYQKNE